jgi:hypothetical protein
MSGHLHASTALTLTIIKQPFCSGMVSEKWGLECVEFTEMVQGVVKCGHYLFVCLLFVSAVKCVFNKCEKSVGPL